VSDHCRCEFCIIIRMLRKTFVFSVGCLFIKIKMFTLSIYSWVAQYFESWVLFLRALDISKAWLKIEQMSHRFLLVITLLILQFSDKKECFENDCGIDFDRFIPIWLSSIENTPLCSSNIHLYLPFQRWYSHV